LSIVTVEVQDGALVVIEEGAGGGRKPRPALTRTRWNGRPSPATEHQLALFVCAEEVVLGRDSGQEAPDSLLLGRHVAVPILQPERRTV
jgi:hypothetical protein